MRVDDCGEPISTRLLHRKIGIRCLFFLSHWRSITFWSIALALFTFSVCSLSHPPHNGVGILGEGCM